jgi:hypothetical protein
MPGLDGRTSSAASAAPETVIINAAANDVARKKVELFMTSSTRYYETSTAAFTAASLKG